MKVVIIGGGIAGLTMGRFLLQKGIDIVINERSSGIPQLGHAFLLHKQGYKILKQLKGNSDVEIPGNLVNAFSLRRPIGKEIKRLQLDSWRCVKRRDLICFLTEMIPKEKIKHNRAFSHFIFDDEKAVAAVFYNGDIEYGDIFIGADGSNSKVRELIHGKIKFSPVEVKEIVGVCDHDDIPEMYAKNFSKFQSKKNGLAFGMIPASDKQFVWFLQYDPALSDVSDGTPDELKFFCTRLLKKFPSVVASLLETNDYSASYVWNTRDFDLLPYFHRQNIVLIGDAAHLALPFTSSGTTDAILDAQTLSQEINNLEDIEESFQKYYDKRAPLINNHILLGRDLKKLFLSPPDNDDALPVPLIDNNNKNTQKKEKPIKILYFTDPICSTCWIIQPNLRKLALEYEEYFDIEYCMGGLLPTWEKFDRGGISRPSDAATHWEEVCEFHETPLDGDIWIEDPLTSSYPPSIAFKAAQLQSREKAVHFLRRIKEMVFMEKKNIIKWEFLEKSAFDVGLDSARLAKDFESKAREHFVEDLILAKQLGVNTFPTLYFSDSTNRQAMIKGYQPYEKFEEIIQRFVPNAVKTKINTDPKALFSQYNRMTEKEFAVLNDIPKIEAKNILEGLLKKGHVNKYESKNGEIYISNFEEE
jgi:2-polyprenyl-6-methoxyphenol hydroxylase-like FAD-dependent oxidoreductase/predicted DsbA family dithiol-disulfide isomerase